MPTVLILGAASDVAVAIARSFAEKGFSIQLAARHPERLQPLQSDLAVRYGASSTLHAFDALQSGRHAGFFASLDPTPDITICVFGLMPDQQEAENDWALCEQILWVNYIGAVSILNAAAGHYAAARKGCIVGISSVAGERGRRRNYLYGSAKAGFTAYLSGLRNRLYKDQVQVLSVLPGFIYTKMTENMPLPKLLTATPQQVAGAVYKGVSGKKNVIYVKWFWRWIMLIIKSIPESIFKKLDL